MNDNINKEVITLPPFKRFCMTIGQLPTSYVESMTYYEAVTWLANYLEKTVIPALNNNGEAVTELQGLFTELQNYVNSYFDNLDVQEEVDHKLDEMVEDGTFEQIIADYTTIPELTSRVETLETSSSTMSTDIDNLEHTVSVNEVLPTIMVGDSYGAGHSAGSVITGWCDLLAKYLGISAANNTYYKIAVGSSGFVHQGTTGKNFLEMLQAEENNITNKNDIKRIIVCGGYNDADGTAVGNIATAVSNFIAYCKTTYPNAIVYVGMVGYNNENSTEGISRRERIADRSLVGYFRGTWATNTSTDNRAVYLSGVENCMKDIGNFSSDHIHPSQDGYIRLAKCIYNALIQGYGYYTQNMQYDQNVTLLNTFSENSSFTVKRTVINDQVLFNFSGSLVYVTPQEISNASLLIGDVGCSNVILGCQGNPRYPINLKIIYSDNSEIYATTYMFVNGSSQLGIYLPKTGTIKQIVIYPSQCFISTKYV